MPKKPVKAAAPPKTLSPIALLLISYVAKIAAKWIADWFIKLISERDWFEQDIPPTGDKVKQLIDEMIVATPRLKFRKRLALRALHHMAPKIAEKKLSKADQEELSAAFMIPKSEQ